MIVHGTHSYDDSKLRPFAGAKRVLNNYFQNECEVMLASGMPEGIGKTAYVNGVEADVYGYLACEDKAKKGWMWKNIKPTERPKSAEIWEMNWEAVKDYIVYLPEDMISRCKNMLLKGRREPVVHWDDGGTWINAMDYNDPFVVAFMKYLTLARSNWGAIIISTPVEEWILKKLHTATGVIRIRIKKPEHLDRRLRWKPRIVNAFRVVRYPNRMRPYWRREWDDRFIAIMPDDFYAWYNPLRVGYAKIAVEEMARSLLRKKRKGIDTSMDEAVLESKKEHIAEANDEAEDFREVIEQIA